MPDLYQAIAAQVAGITPDKVRLHVMKTGGGFGRRAAYDADVIVEAVAAANALGWRAPVKVQWTREDDMKGGRYRPAYVHALKAGLDAQGNLVAWQHHIVGQSILAGRPFEAMVEERHRPHLGRGRAHLPYAIPNRRLGSPPPMSACRCSGGARSARPTPPSRRGLPRRAGGGGGQGPA